MLFGCFLAAAPYHTKFKIIINNPFPAVPTIIYTMRSLTSPPINFKNWLFY